MHSFAAHLLLLSGAAGAVFLAGGPQEGSAGIAVLASGAALLIFSRGAKVDRIWWALGGLLVVFAASALLPQHLLPLPEWRKHLEENGTIPLARSVSIVPRETFFFLGMLVAAVCAGIFGLAHPLRSKAQLAVALFASLICAIYAVLAIYSGQSGWHYPFDFDQAFGFFPNTNHTSTFLVTGSLVALGIVGVAFRTRYWITGTAGAICLATCVSALVFFSHSRGGIIFLGAGALLWLIGLGRAHRSKPLVISFAAVFLAGIVLFLNSQSEVRDRVLKLAGLSRSLASAAPPPGGAAVQQKSEVGNVPWDTRLLIYGDTLRMIGDFPFTGTGLGSFRYVFPFYRERYVSEALCIHPESDWLMLAAEAGIPAALIAATAIILLIRRSRQFNRHPFWPLRWGIVCAVLAALLHGFVDAPAHRIPLGWWILTIAGIGFQMPPRDGATAPRSQHAFFVTAGLAACALAIFLIRAEWFGGQPSPPLAAQRAMEQILKLEKKEQWWESGELAREAIKISPMADPLYFRLAVALLHYETTEAEVDTLFQAQRLLDPDWSKIPFDQGTAWMNIDPARTTALWLEALRRRERIDGNQRVAISWYGELVARGAKYPTLQKELFAASAKGPDFTVAWLEHAEAPLVAAELPRLAADESFLWSLSEKNRRRFLNAWYSKGGREGMFEFAAIRPEWEQAVWSLQIRRLVDSSKFEEAVRAATDRYGISLALPELGKEDTAKSSASGEALAEFEQYWRLGNLVTARRILDEASAQSAAANPEVWRLKAAISASEGQWQTAWQNLEKYFRASRIDALL